MSDIAIKVENLGKLYQIGAQQERYRTLRETLVSSFAVPLRRMRSTFQHSNVQPANDFIWALKDISFEVKQGEVVGIIGRNGAGKSTLLKILSHITEPTEGKVHLRGRVGSLLEVGTGFHPELTGRENIYLNGAILGMKKAEIERKFDEIVAFAEIERFLDTPVKRYSSGMYVRLAFAVAAHMEPEILLVDEVLAVGDAEFQKKCLGKMGQVAGEGRTVLFVSHNMGAVQGLCERGIWLEGGRVSMNGLVREAVFAYLAASSNRQACISIEKLPRVTGGDDIRLINLELLDQSGHHACQFDHGDRMLMRFWFRVLNPGQRYFAIEWTICTSDGNKVLYASSSPQGQLLISPIENIGCVECEIPCLPLTSGRYFINCLLSLPHQKRIDEVEAATSFDVTTCDIYNTGFDVRQSLAPVTTATHWNIVEGAQSLLRNSNMAPQSQIRG